MNDTSEMVKKSSKPEKATCNLPPTSAAARYHNPRVYFQVNEEKGDIILVRKTTDLLSGRPKLLHCWTCFDVTVEQIVAH